MQSRDLPVQGMSCSWPLFCFLDVHLPSLPTQCQGGGADRASRTVAHAVVTADAPRGTMWLRGRRPGVLVLTHRPLGRGQKGTADPAWAQSSNDPSEHQGGNLGFLVGGLQV